MKKKPFSNKKAYSFFLKVRSEGGLLHDETCLHREAIGQFNSNNQGLEQHVSGLCLMFPAHSSRPILLEHFCSNHSIICIQYARNSGASDRRPKNFILSHTFGRRRLLRGVEEKKNTSQSQERKCHAMPGNAGKQQALSRWLWRSGSSRSRNLSERQPVTGCWVQKIKHTLRPPSWKGAFSKGLFQDVVL